MPRETAENAEESGSLTIFVSLIRAWRNADTPGWDLQVARLDGLAVVVARPPCSIFEQFGHVLVESVVEIARNVHLAQFVLHSRFDDGICHRHALLSILLKVAIFARLGVSPVEMQLKSGGPIS